jgi:hypothetical protein
VSAESFGVSGVLDLLERAISGCEGEISVVEWLDCHVEPRRRDSWNHHPKLAWLVLWRVSGCGCGAIAGERGMIDIWS